LRCTKKQHGISPRFAVETVTVQSTYNVALDSLRGQSRHLEQESGITLEWPLQLLRFSRAMNLKPRFQLLNGCITLLAHHLKVFKVPRSNSELVPNDG